MRRLLVMAAMLAVPYALAAIQLPVRVLTTADGLPRDQLACVYSDDRGFVWFCTADGLVRYDGYAAPAFGRSDGLSNPGVRTFVRDRERRSWTGGDAGLFEFLPNATEPRQRFVEIHRADGQPTGSINAIVEGRDGDIWCGGGHGLVSLPRGSDRLVEVDIGLPRATENDRIVRAVLEDERGSLWVGAGSGLYRRTRDGHVRRLTVENGLPVNEVWTLAFDAAQRLWAGTREGLVLIDRERVEHGDVRVTRRVYTAADGVPAGNVKALRADGDTLWIGTVVGLAEARVRPSLDLEIGRTLLGFYVWSIDIGRRGEVWAATGDGARRLAGHGFTTFLEEDGLAATRVASVFETNDGEVCATILVVRLRLSCFDGKAWTLAPAPSVAGIADYGWGWSQLTHQDRAGRWWIPTGEGLLQFAAGPIATLATARPVAIYSRKSGLPSNGIFRVYEDRAGDIWAATFSDESGSGLIRIEPVSGSVRAFGPRDGLPMQLPIPHAFAEDDDGNLWIGLEEGLLLRYRSGRFEEIALEASAKPRLTSEHLRALLVDRRGRLWIASTTSGLGRIDRPASAHPAVRWYGAAQGLSSDTAWVLAESDDENIFVGTARGVDSFDPRTERFTYFTNDEGVPRGELWGTLRDHAGRIWFATTGGLSLLIPNASTPQQPPTTFVTSVRISGTAWPISADGSTRVDGITVPPNDRRMDIEFVSPGARAADGVRYQYRLGDVDRAWTESTTRSVSLAGIASGTYRFQVRAMLASGVTGEPATVAFTVLAPVWRRWWFVTLAIAAVAGIAWMFHRIRIGRLLEVERVRSRIAADLHDGVGASLSRIALLSEVARSQAEAGLPAVAPALASIGQHARDLIDDMSDAVWFIDPQVDNLQTIVIRIRALASGLFDERSIAWTLDAPDDAARIRLAPEHRRHIYLMLKESLTNVVRHAAASSVVIRIAIRDARVHVEVEDDGVGIQLQTMPPSKGGRGLTSLRARAAELGGAVRFEAGAQGRGTRIVLDVPLATA